MAKTLSNIASKIRLKSRNSVKYREQLDILEKQNELMDQKIKSVEETIQKYRFFLRNLDIVHFLKMADNQMVNIIHFPILEEFLKDVLQVRKILTIGVQDLRSKITSKQAAMLDSDKPHIEMTNQTNTKNVEKKAKKQEILKLNMNIKKLKEQLEEEQKSLNDLRQKYGQCQFDTNFIASSSSKLHNENRKIGHHHQKHPIHLQANDFVPASSLVRKNSLW